MLESGLSVARTLVKLSLDTLIPVIENPGIPDETGAPGSLKSQITGDRAASLEFFFSSSQPVAEAACIA